jgi:diguanylate cyclase (GGDEF)-like protein
MSAPPPVRRLLFVDQDPTLTDRVKGLLTSSRRPLYRVAQYTHLIDALTYLRVAPVDIVLIGTGPADVDSVQACRKVRAAFPEVAVLALAPEKQLARGVSLREAGALEVLGLEDFNTEFWSRTFDYCLREMSVTRELTAVTARLDWLVHTDALTGLLNRKGLERYVQDQVGRCRDNGLTLPLLLLDLDDFDRINATLGHGVGDLVLMAAANRIAESVGPQDKVGRCGTDRFVVLLPGSTEEEAESMAEKIRLAVSRDMIQAGEHSLTTTASLGITSVDLSSLSFNEILAQAQFVLQRSKLKGKNRVAKAAIVDEVEMITPVEVGPDMVQALLRGNILQVSSQPIVNLTDGRIVSQEMLIRGPQGPLNRPDNLFRYCQEKDILTAVDLRCLKRCAEAARNSSPRGVRYHVNILPATLLQTPVEELIRVLKVNDDYGHCVLEISEQQLLGDPTVLVPRVRSLQEAGIRIAIDDVGFGNSCLEGLLMLHPEIMKVDKRLVQGLAIDQDLRTTLTRLLKVAAVLGAEVVAEGIEDADDYRLLLDMGVKLGQGYLFGRPRPVDLPRVNSVDVVSSEDPDTGDRAHEAGA